MQQRHGRAEERRTRIVATIGPATAEDAMLERLLEAGMDAARVNFSHGDPASKQIWCAGCELWGSERNAPWR
jgi:pyruvate kinase